MSGFDVSADALEITSNVWSYAVRIAMPSNELVSGVLPIQSVLA